MAGVEEQGGAGGEFAVEDDEVGRAWEPVAVDGEGEILGAEDGIEADEAFVGSEQRRRSCRRRG